EAGGDRLRVGDRGQLVGEDRAQHARARLVGPRLHRGEPGKTLDQRVVDRPLGIGPDLAKPADRDLDDAGRDVADRRPAVAAPTGGRGNASILPTTARLPCSNGSTMSRSSPTSRKRPKRSTPRCWASG